MVETEAEKDLVCIKLKRRVRIVKIQSEILRGFRNEDIAIETS